MCPKDEILSAYYDGEIDSPWNTEIGQHLQTCSSCRARITSFQKIRERLAHEPLEIEEPMQRVQKRLQESFAAAGLDASPHIYRSTSSFWKRQVPVPMPALAAAAVVFFVLVAGVFFFLGKNDIAQVVKNQTGSEGVQNVQVYYSVDNPELLRKILTDRDYREEVIIELPEDNEFSIIGDPEIKRVTDVRGR
ncbi:MAG: hypothetical protein EHM28_01345 [Spirochaetaceae bacterium]|nr:MAG: hypothetical protein EHM28_01345 [Spirochaetaceae bacterium]